MIKSLINFHVPLIALLFLPFMAGAQHQSPADELYDLLRLDETLEILNQESLAAASTIADEFFGGNVPNGWERDVKSLYANEPARAKFRSDVKLALDGKEVVRINNFFSSGLGQKIVDLEISARRAMISDVVSDQSDGAMREAQKIGSSRFDQILQFIEVNDLIEYNVQGSLNTNLAFMNGLQQADVFKNSMTEDQILSLVWSQEDEIRAETTDWLQSYLMLAYEPLTDAELSAYTQISELPEGKQVNAALFWAFDQLFTTQSHLMGQLIAGYLQGSDI